MRLTGKKSSSPRIHSVIAERQAGHHGIQRAHALRPALVPAGVSVHGVYPGGIDTDMLAGIDTPKAATHDVANAILDGVTAGQSDIYPDPTSAQMSQLWNSDPRTFTEAFAAMGS